MAGLIVADASVLIAWLDDRDPHHQSAIEILGEVDRFIVDPLTLAETLVHPARQGREVDVIARLEAIAMEVSNRVLDPMRLARLRANIGLKLHDCVVVDCAVDHGVGLASFDSALRAAAEDLGIDVAPM